MPWVPFPHVLASVGQAELCLGCVGSSRLPSPPGVVAPGPQRSLLPDVPITVSRLGPRDLGRQEGEWTQRLALDALLPSGGVLPAYLCGVCARTFTHGWVMTCREGEGGLAMDPGDLFLCVIPTSHGGVPRGPRPRERE